MMAPWKPCEHPARARVVVTADVEWCATCGAFRGGAEWETPDRELQRGNEARRLATLVRLQADQERLLTAGEIRDAIGRAYCATCGHLLQMHGAACLVVGCDCEGWVSR